MTTRTLVGKGQEARTTIEMRTDMAANEVFLVFQVFVWCMGVLVLLLAMSSFAFAVQAISDLLQERRELACLAERAAKEREQGS